MYDDASLLVGKCLMTHIRSSNCSMITHNEKSEITYLPYLCSFSAHVTFMNEFYMN